jgi:hypothetical protein
MGLFAGLPLLRFLEVRLPTGVVLEAGAISVPLVGAVDPAPMAGPIGEGPGGLIYFIPTSMFLISI